MTERAAAPEGAGERPGGEAPEALLRAALAHTLLAQAAGLARGGDYGAAEAVVKECLTAHGATAPAWDLLARIQAQQGRLKTAEECWVQALELEPGNQGYQAGLRRIAELNRDRGTIFKWVKPVCFAAILGALLLAGWLAFNTTFRTYERRMLEQLGRLDEKRALQDNYFKDTGARLAQIERQTKETAAQLSLVRENLAKQTGRDDAKTAQLDATLQSLQTGLLKMAQATTTPPDPGRATGQPPKLELALPGIAVRTERDSLILQFERGLFESRTRLSEEARVLLKALGRRLKESGAGLFIDVEGHTDDLPVPPDAAYEDNYELGWRRAAAVTQQLIHESSLPARNFRIDSKGELAPPYPNDTAENRRRNRTVIVRIGPAGEAPGRGTP